MTIFCRRNPETGKDEMFHSLADYIEGYTWTPWDPTPLGALLECYRRLTQNETNNTFTTQFPNDFNQVGVMLRNAIDKECLRIGLPVRMDVRNDPDWTGRLGHGGHICRKGADTNFCELCAP